jgi:predicted RNase H-like HicB family nuclease
MPKTLTAYVEYDRKSKLYVGMVPGIRGAHTQAATLDELQDNPEGNFGIVYGRG